MAFGDLLKKAASKGMEFVGDAVEIGKQIVEEQKEAAAKKAEEERIEKEKIEAEKREAAELKKKAELERKQKEMEAILKPTCDKGDCLWHHSRFYFTCSKECECERKKYTKTDWDNENVIPEFWPYMKRLEKLQKKGAFDVDVEAEICKDFMKEFLPQYGVGMWGIAREFIKDGLSSRNKMLSVFFVIKDAPKQNDIIEKLQHLNNDYSFQMRDCILEHGFCKKLSLYNRSTEDFIYTVNLFATVLDKEKLSRCFKDISGISEEQFYDSDGNIKPAGCGGPQEGFYGDTLHNTVNSWLGENDENDMFLSYEEFEEFRLFFK